MFSAILNKMAEKRKIFRQKNFRQTQISDGKIFGHKENESFSVQKFLFLM